jgi:predicted Zn-dependent protease with MMP-like domain
VLPGEIIQTMADSSFQQLVAEALNSLPEEIASRMQNVEVVVVDEPPLEYVRRLPRGTTLLGHYHGVPLTRRGFDYEKVLPDMISIYRGPIERMARTPERIREQVRRTVIHEVAHHFGIDDDRLDELGWS